MTYQFRKMLERPDWVPPMAISLDITYECESVLVSRYDDEESSGGVTWIKWIVARIWYFTGQVHNPDDYAVAREKLEAEPDLDERLADYCLQDFAERQI